MRLMNIGDRIRERRQGVGLSQSALARLVGVAPQSVQQWEGGRTEPRGQRLDIIADKLQTSVVWLITGDHRAIDESFQQNSEVDQDLLAEVIATVEIVLKSRDKAPSVAAKADLITLVYDIAAGNDDHRVNEGVVIRLADYLQGTKDENGRTSRKGRRPAAG